MTLMLVALGIYFYILDNDPPAASNLGWLPITSLCVFLIAYSIGYGPLPWVLISEIYSKEYNAIAGSLNGTFSHLLAFAVTSSFGSVTSAIGNGPTFWLYAAFSLLGVFFSVYVVIETKAKSMIEIQRILSGEKVIK
jgi:Sugar (and other) transporter